MRRKDKTVSTVAQFLQHGWKNIWKQDTIFFFSALPLLDQLFQLFLTETYVSTSFPWVEQVRGLLSTFVLFISVVGVSYTAFCSSMDQSVSISEVLVAIRKFAGRIVGCSCLVFLLLSPLAYLVLAFSRNESTQPSPTSNNFALLWILFSLFAAIADFTMFGFFSNDWGLRKSLKQAWVLFTAHFGVLAALGILLAVVFRMSGILLGALSVLIQSGFDMTALGKIHLVDPLISSNSNLLFVVLNGVAQIVLSPFQSSTFAVAYRDYRAINVSANEANQTAA
jgi:hypothetical protein